MFHTSSEKYDVSLLGTVRLFEVFLFLPTAPTCVVVIFVPFTSSLLGFGFSHLVVFISLFLVDVTVKSLKMKDLCECFGSE